MIIAKKEEEWVDKTHLLYLPSFILYFSPAFFVYFFSFLFPSPFLLSKDIVNNAGRLKEFFKVSKLARSLSRFPVPVILIGNKACM